MKSQVDELRRRRNEISDGFKSADPAERPALGQKAKARGAEISGIEAALGEKSEALNALLLRLPGIPWEGAPVGPDESFNTVVRQKGAVPDFVFEPRDPVPHVAMNRCDALGRTTQDSRPRPYSHPGR